MAQRRLGALKGGGYLPPSNASPPSPDCLVVGTPAGGQGFTVAVRWARAELSPRPLPVALRKVGRALLPGWCCWGGVAYGTVLQHLLGVGGWPGPWSVPHGSALTLQMAGWPCGLHESMRRMRTCCAVCRCVFSDCSVPPDFRSSLSNPPTHCNPPPPHTHPLRKHRLVQVGVGCWFQDFLGPLFVVVLKAGLGVCDALVEGRGGSFMSVIVHSVHHNTVPHITL